jgi:hypothetical protein
MSPDAPDYSFERAAQPWIRTGWPLIPVVGKGRARAHLVASTDPEQIHRWAGKFPRANPGVVLKGLPVIVLDIDGDEGEIVLADLLAKAGCDLPETYQERTGREGRGRHIFLKTAAGTEQFPSQYGGQASRPKGLDVLVNGHVVVAGALHRSGQHYEAVSDIVPLESLTQVPDALYTVLLARRSAASLREPKPAVRPRLSNVSTAGTVRHGVVPQEVRALLIDASDGRDNRCFVAVSHLVHQGWDEGSIIDLVLRSPLGDKARQERPHDPHAWVRHKIDSVRERAGEPFDADVFWQAAHSAGLTSSSLRVLDFLWASARLHGGTVSVGLGRIGLGSAVNQAAPTVTTLISTGWLEVVKEAQTGEGIPRVYRLRIPTTPDGEEMSETTTEVDREPYRPSPPAPGTPVTVTPGIVFVGADEVVIKFPPRDTMLTARGQLLDALTWRRAALDAPTVTAIVDVAQRPGTWR